MPSPSWERLDEFLDPADFAVPASIVFQDGGSRAVNGIYDDPFMDAQLGEFDYTRRKPRFLIKETDAAGVRRGDTLTMDGRTYDILDMPEFTGDGMATLCLADPA